MLRGDGGRTSHRPALGELVDFLMFTGSTRTGRLSFPRPHRIYRLLAQLGGKNPMVVLAEANLNEAWMAPFAARLPAPEGLRLRGANLCAGNDSSSHS